MVKALIIQMRSKL